VPHKAQPKWALPLGINRGVFAVYLLIAPPTWVVMKPLVAAPMVYCAQATDAAADMEVVRVATLNYQADELS
jgi:hypothetical protein